MRRVRTAELRRRELIDAVLSILSTEGWDKLTVKRVAALSHVAPGAMPHFLGSKNDMIAAAIDHHYRVCRERDHNFISATASPVSKLWAWFETTAFPRGNVKEEWALWLCMWGRIPFDESVRRGLAPVYQEHVNVLQTIIEEGTSRGYFEPVSDVSATADQLVAIIDGLMMRHLLDSEFPEERVRSLVGSFIKGALGLAADRPSRSPQ